MALSKFPKLKALKASKRVVAKEKSTPRRRALNKRILGRLTAVIPNLALEKLKLAKYSTKVEAPARLTQKKKRK